MSRCREPVLAALLFAAGCTDAKLYTPPQIDEPIRDDKLVVSGTTCADAASDLSSFLKIALVVDQSNSMRRTDPANRRVLAAQQVVQRFVEDPATARLRPGVEFAVVGFYGDVVTYTRDARGLPGFSADGPEVLASVLRLAQVSSNTSYEKTLAQVFLLLDTDMARLPATARARSRYEIVFMSDGMPFPDNCRNESNAPSAAVSGVERIASLSVLHGIPIAFNTAFASVPEMFGTDVDACTGASDPYEEDYDTVGDETSALLLAMSRAGGGTYKQFKNGDSITFAEFEFAESRRMYALASLLASNVTALPTGVVPAADTDGDGLADLDELLVGSHPNLADSDGDGLGDGIEWRYRLSGRDPLDGTDGQCPPHERVDTDGDGLLDCEEIFLGTSRRALDSDGDGLPDNVELVLGGHAGSADPVQDHQGDDDADGGSNADEVRWHTDPQQDDAGIRARLAYQYATTQLPLTSGRACYDFAVANVALASTRATPPELLSQIPAAPAGRNRVMLYFAETPYDDPFAEPLYRVACAEARFVADRDLKDPPGGTLVIPARRPSDNYRPASVLRPATDVCQASVAQDCGVNALWCQHESDGRCTCRWPNGTPAGDCPACADGRDNDGDGRTDYPYDPDCFDSLDPDEGSGTACSNGIDDDGDGKIDWPADPGCASGYDLDETDPPTQPECANGVDDDADGVADFGADPDCYAAADETERLTAVTAHPCDDGADNDGDGRIDLADPGCFDPNDIDEDGPSACFACELDATRPGQCLLAEGLCKPRAGTACTSRRDCRGAPCVDGACVPCLRDRDCDSAPGAADGLCDERRGWCLEAAYTPRGCTGDAECAAPAGPGGRCETDIGYCDVDPYRACQDDGDCGPEALCSRERGFCLRRIFAAERCRADGDCTVGVCDTARGFCLPPEEARCAHDDECPYGECVQGSCDQPSFVPPERFRPAIDCARPL